MSGQITLDVAALTVSLFNTLLLAWLGLVVALNTERRTWGVLLAIAGLLSGGAFFLAHSIVLSQGAAALVQSFSLWWHTAWVPLIAAPFTWYLLMLWYSGFWETAQNRLRRRQVGWLAVLVVYTLLLAGLLVSANPLTYAYGANGEAAGRFPLIGGLPWVILAYPPYILLCIGLALDALLRPAPAARLLGDLARRKARPWLVYATLLLALVALLVGAAFLWLVRAAGSYQVATDLFYAYSLPLSIFDLLLAALLMGVVLLLGQAVIAYEVFTATVLPRRGFSRQWRLMVVFSLVASLVTASLLFSGAPRVWIGIGLLLLSAVALAVLSRQSFAEREAAMRMVRPFTTSQRLMESILTLDPEGAPVIDLAAPFAALCRDVLGARHAWLEPLGSLAALGIAPLVYRPEFEAQNTGFSPSGRAVLSDLLPQLQSPQMIGVPLDPQVYGAVWAAPLWSERGLVGLLLLGEKSDGGFYSQEEIEIARAGGERLADSLASVELARRLVVLQRQRLAESRVLDRQTRRLLHDEVLPGLHSAVLQLSASGAAGKDVMDQLAEAHRRISDLLRELPPAAPHDLLQNGLPAALRRFVENELTEAFDRVEWQVDAQAEAQLTSLPSLTLETIFYATREAIRNAARHAHPANGRPLHLTVSINWRGGLHVLVEDNGAGFTPGLVPASGLGPEEGAGQGLALHSTLMAVVGGSLALESKPGEGTRVELFLPE